MKGYYNKWRIERHNAGVKRRCCILRRTRIERMHFLINEGYRTNFMGLCYRRRLKLKLGGRRVCVAFYTIVVLQGER